MIGIDEANTNNNVKKVFTKEELENAKKEYVEVIDKIKATIGKKDFTEIKEDVKLTLRQLYTSASLKAKNIADKCGDEKMKEEYLVAHQKLLDRAVKCGSILKNSVPKTSFDDVKGLDEVKKLIKSFLFVAQNPDIAKYYKIDGGLGVMMYGAPGTGKTMFAEAVAHEMNLPLFVVTPADIFKSHVGESEENVRQLFNEIDACPDGAVLFVDECESIFSVRKADTQDYKSAVTTELLQRINGFGVDGGKRIMIAATNRPEMIDPAYLRYKRFSNLIHITPPDIVAKRAIIEHKLKGIEIEGVTIDELAEMSENYVTKIDANGNTYKEKNGYYSAADISGIIEEACRQALAYVQQNNLSKPVPVTKEMFVSAFSKIPPSISNKVLEEYNNFRKTNS